MLCIWIFITLHVMKLVINLVHETSFCITCFFCQMEKPSRAASWRCFKATTGPHVSRWADLSPPLLCSKFEEEIERIAASRLPHESLNTCLSPCFSFYPCHIPHLLPRKQCAINGAFFNVFLLPNSVVLNVNSSATQKQLSIIRILTDHIGLRVLTFLINLCWGNN